MTIKPEHSYQQNTGHHGAQVITGSGETLVLCIVCKRRMSEGKNGTMPENELGLHNHRFTSPLIFSKF